jgi:glyoxylase-like metal-dependent hydrolase (beta-lactamase superfamily II)
MSVRTITHGQYRTNTYIVDDGVSGQALLVDPTENPDGCIEAAQAAGLEIAAIVATHSHFDHVGGVAGVKERLGVPFMIGRHALEGLRREASRALEGGIEIPEPPEPDRLLDDGDLVEVGDLSLLVLNTPGHWRGDISLYAPSAGIVFTGDCLHKGEIGRYNQGCDEAELLQSIETKLMTLPDETLVYSGHGPVTTVGEERRTNRGLLRLPRRS